MFGRNEQMGRTAFKLMAGCLLALTAVSSTTAQGYDSVRKVVRRTVDDTQTYYNLTCEDGQQGRLTVNSETDEVCAYRFGEPEICEVSVPIMQAAESACSA